MVKCKSMAEPFTKVLDQVRFFFCFTLWLIFLSFNFQETGATTSLALVTMGISKEYVNTSEIPNDARMTRSVELCDCPREFTGDSCEQCAGGFTRRVPNTGPYSMNSSCVPCSCNGNSEKCDPETGICIECKHNTTGRLRNAKYRR